MDSYGPSRADEHGGIDTGYVGPNSSLRDPYHRSPRTEGMWNGA